jgi:hypothetical protein
MYGAGRLSADVLLCAEHDSAWHPVTDLLGPPTVPPVQASVALQSVPRGQWTPQSLLLPILATLFCCLIGGIVAIVTTSQANSKGAAGDIVGAQRDVKTARNWLILSALTPVILMAAYFLLIFVALLMATFAASQAVPPGGTQP